MAISARITYLLSNAGRRDSLRTGGNGQRKQMQDGPVPPEDLDAFLVDESGNVSLDATCLPPFELTMPESDWAKVLKSASSNDEVEWDVVPTWDYLLAFARFQRDVWRKEQEERDSIEAEALEHGVAFFEDANARAEKIEDDCVTISGHAYRNWPQLVAEAKRRWASDQVARRERKQATLAAWIEEHGSTNQQQRLKAGLLPWQEAHDAVEQALFARVDELFRRYERFNVDDVCVCEQFGEGACGLKFQSVDATELTADEWEVYRGIKDVEPDATFQLREHRAWCRSKAAAEMRRGVIVKRTLGSLTFKREYALGGTHDVERI